MGNEVHLEPCPDPDCDNGVILVHDAYSKDPLIGEKQVCPVCFGLGFLVVGGEVSFC